ncbi:MAG TPA: hypothetical protein VFI54_26515 [Solirubrobacteraceae bacterium]|nr:hypothetical protein [Solirubrobacteraceae bacterium]
MSEVADLFLLVYLIFALIAFAIEAFGARMMRRAFPSFPRQSKLDQLLRALRDPWVVFGYARFAFVMFVSTIRGSGIEKEVVPESKRFLTKEELAEFLRRDSDAAGGSCTCNCVGCVAAHIGEAKRGGA